MGANLRRAGETSDSCRLKKGERRPADSLSLSIITFVSSARGDNLWEPRKRIYVKEAILASFSNSLPLGLGRGVARPARGRGGED